MIDPQCEGFTATPLKLGSIFGRAITLMSRTIKPCLLVALMPALCHPLQQEDLYTLGSFAIVLAGRLMHYESVLPAAASGLSFLWTLLLYPLFPYTIARR